PPSAHEWIASNRVVTIQVAARVEVLQACCACARRRSARPRRDVPPPALLGTGGGTQGGTEAGALVEPPQRCPRARSRHGAWREVRRSRKHSPGCPTCQLVPRARGD